MSSGSATTSSELTESFGLRDHSWGPRVLAEHLVVPLGHRELRSLGDRLHPPRRDPTTACATSAATCTTSPATATPDSSRCATWTLASEYDDEWFVTRNQVLVTTDDHAYELHGDVWSSIPLRNRRAGKVTRITEGMTRWTCGDLTGAGLSEYLDQVVDDLPVGIAAGS